MGTAFEDALAWATGAASGLDWGAALELLAVALAAAAIATAVGLSIAFYLRNGPLPTGVLPGAVEAGMRRWHRARGTAGRTRWLCGRCRSWNVASAEACYRGCGLRGAVEMPLLDGVEDAARDVGGGSSSEGSAPP
jgi:hypothetical protein